MYTNEEHKNIVENRGYKYIWSYDRKEITIDRKNKNKNKIYIRVKCSYCKKEYDIDIYTFKNGANCKYCCNKHENSFAHYIEQELNQTLDNYWDWEKNTINPYYIYKSSKNKVWIKCQEKDYHIYEVTCNKFYQGRRCPYCDSFASNKVHPLDSFGALYPEKAKYRSKRNNKSPYEVAQFSHEKYWFYCENCGEEFQRYLNNINRRGDSLKCHKCTSSKGEQMISNWLIKNNIKFETQKGFYGLVGINRGNLSYDFYLPNNNLLIEYQGEQHKRFVRGFHITKEGFEKQKEHDKRKREYAKQHNIDLLEIRYWDFNNIEEILQDKIVGD